MIKKHWFTRVLLFIKNDKAYCWADIESLEELRKAEGILNWEYWREIQEPEYKPFTWEDR